ncbi:EpsG family protein [Shewanella sp. MF05960]|uniref:EpsG family protein n=1 Tax=Shewanella sp. MF05960 TaxID=3434874 RepID=UPI003D7BCA5C
MIECNLANKFNNEWFTVYYLPVFFAYLSVITCVFTFKFENVNSKKISFLLIFISYFFLFLLVAFKGPIEPDYYSYRDIFYLAPDFNSINLESIKKSIEASFGIEPGIILLSSFLHYLGFDYQVLIIFFSILNVFLTLCICKRFPQCVRYTCLAFILCIFFQSYFVQIRFATGVFFTILACLHFIEGKLKRSFSLFFLGLLFHNVASLYIFIIPAFFASRKVIDRYYLILPLIFFIGMINFTVFLEFFIESFFSRYLIYLSLSEGFSGNPILFYWRWILYSFLMLLLYFRENELSKSDSIYESFFKFCLYMNLVSWAVGYNFAIFYRVSWFFDIGLLYFVFAYKRSSFFYKKIVCFSLLLFLFGYRLFSYMADFDTFYFDWYYN